MADLMSPEVVIVDEPFGSIMVIQKVVFAPEEPVANAVVVADCEFVIFNDEFMDIRQ